MRSLYDKTSFKQSKCLTKDYSTSFSLAISMMPKIQKEAIYAIYGFVRIADEVVDTFHDQNKKELLDEFEHDTYQSIKRGISLNPILNSFQKTVNTYNIEHALIDGFLKSMRMDLETTEHCDKSYSEYIYGSAEVVGLMCLRVFLNGDEAEYQRLKPMARHLGAAFQKVNFLRDMKSDAEGLGRIYFPGFDLTNMSSQSFKEIYADIEKDFDIALKGISQLPKSSRLAVYTAYKYYRNLFFKIQKLDYKFAFDNRIRIPNGQKIYIMAKAMLRHQLNIL